ncbi:MAG: prolyl oligopeptidase family serine peptidase [Bacteroidales bacterium]
MRKSFVLLFAIAAGIARLTGASFGAHTPLVAGQVAPRVPFTAEDMMNVASIAVADLSDDGVRVAVTLRRTGDNAEVDNYRYGDPTYVSPLRARLVVINTQSGETAAPFKDAVNVGRAAWSHDGRRLAILLTERPAPAQAAGGPALFVWDAVRATLSEVPARTNGGAISSNTGIDWTADDKRVIVTLRTPQWEREAKQRFRQLTTGPVIVHSSKDPLLEWDALQRSARRRVLASIDVATGETTALLPEKRISSYNVARDGSFVTLLEDVTEKTDYDEIGGTMNRLVLAQAATPGAGGPQEWATKTITEAKDLKGVTLRWADDGRTFAYARKGEVFVQRLDEPKARSLTPEVAASLKAADKAALEPADQPKDAEKKDDKKESFAVGPFSRNAAQIVITSKKGWYVVDVATGAREQVLKLNEEDEEKNPKIEAIDWSPDGKAIYLAHAERDRWQRGVQRLTIATRTLSPLLADARLYAGFRMARDGRTFVFTASDGDRPNGLFVADAEFRSVRRLADSNPWMADRLLPRSELVAYRDADGKVLYGVLRYPVNYVKGQKYPTVFEIYETFFDNGFNARAAFLANHGYAVFHPSVNLVVGRPGEAWVKGVTSAANKLIEMGVADPDRLGVHGTSYGGYATVLLLTQTDRFKAAINVSGKVNMVSFYTDSPRLGVRNIHAPEKSQDRLGATLWEHPDRYLEHSAILHADRITTPLLCITGDQDPNVPSSQSREIYYALRRLGKEVEWVRYVNGAHRPPNSVSESVDFEQRIVKWYDDHLKGELKKKATT